MFERYNVFDTFFAFASFNQKRQCKTLPFDVITTLVSQKYPFNLFAIRISNAHNLIKNSQVHLLPLPAFGLAPRSANTSPMQPLWLPIEVALLRLTSPGTEPLSIVSVALTFLSLLLS